MFEDYAVLLSIISTILTFVTLVSVRGASLKPPLKDPITYSILAINLVVTALLPLQLAREFPVGQDAPIAYAPYIFYFRHYPHITVYPVLLFGLATLFVFRALYVWWEVAPVKASWRIAFAAVLGLVVTFWEAGGRQMMLFEFNRQAQAAMEPFNYEPVVRRASDVGLRHAFDPASTLGQQVIEAVNNGLQPPDAATHRMDELLNHYEAWNALGVAWKSKSRSLYTAIFVYMTFVMFLGFALSIYLPRTGADAKLQEKRDTNISVNLLGAFFVFLLWMPFRIFSNINTKIPLFGPNNIWDNFFGKLPLTSAMGLTPADILPLCAIILFAVITVLRIRRIARTQSVLLFTVCGALVAFGLAALARANREAFLEVCGIDQDLRFISFRILFTTVMALLIYQYVESIPPKISGDSEQ